MRISLQISLIPTSIAALSILSRRNLFQQHQIFLLSSSITPSTPSSPHTLTTSEIYDLAAASYDDEYSNSLTSKLLNFDQLRSDLIEPNARGKCLELAVGTGLNLPYYEFSRDGVESLECMDISKEMLRIAEKKAQRLGLSSEESTPPKTNFRVGNVESLPFDTDTFDTIISTFSLCVFEHPVRVLTEAKRVLRHGGMLLLLEHDDGFVGKMLSPTRGVSDVASSCNYGQDVLGMLRSVGFEVKSSSLKAGGVFRKVVATG